MLESHCSIRVRYAETDMMGIVYHGSYLPWLEVGRTTLLREHGFNYRDMDEAGYRLPVLEVAVKYHRPALYDDEVTIHTVIDELPGLRIKIRYRVLRGEELLVTATTQHAFIDRSGRPVRPPSAFTRGMKAKFQA
ncbi:acyl-CoA thioesterase [Synoicihabitans lomoniglobus]|uniref:Thioesterase family protein n=1 Tax=Synoicihabitans lomoniglobus TaxID=2909285 RepID=A0AAF0I877_9BACT|nr:acyl-CoA thioesterase [Opitutaceae bacterium LMO-M01]WED67426.1 thioesterase family protein [Opitutaceae bacterium LMO-M01]